MASLKADNPDVEIVSRYSIGADTIAALEMSGGEITEWVPLDCKEKITKIGGVPIGTTIRR